MNIGNFLQEYKLHIIFAFIFAIIAEIILKPFRKLFGWIRKNITKAFASKKFEQNYRDWLINKYRFLNVRGIKTNAPVAIELERIFISLRTKKPAEKVRFSEIESKMKEEGIDKIPEIEEFNRREFLGRRIESETEKTYELKDLFNLSHKRFIIIGAPGSGKTTLLNYLALKFARKSEKELFEIENEFLPTFINLRDTIKEGFLDVKNFVENYNNYIECSDSPPQDFFKKKLDEGECIILLDGLDEVATVEQRASVAKWVDELATAYSRNIFIATSRPYGYETAHLYNDFLELHILDFTPEQIEEFIRYWTKAVEIKAREDESDFTLKEAQKNADDLLQAIKETPKIEALTVNPLLLTIVAIVHRYKGHLPERRVELYEDCCDVLLGLWDKAKGIAVELLPRQKRTVLQPLAYYLHLNGLREEKREKFIELLENELPKIGVPKEKADDLLDDIRYRCGILVETKLGFFGFSHLTFQEFLTARHILDCDLESFLVNRKRDKYWLEVTLLYCGMKDTTNLLNKILKEREDIFYTNLFLAGGCLAESLSVSPELRAGITEKLFDIYWRENEFDKSKEIALEILKEIKDQNIISNLLELLKDKGSGVRRHAAYALGQIQAKESVNPLLVLLKDKERDVRGSAAYALGQIQAKEAVSSLIDLLRDKEWYVRGSTAYVLGKIQAKGAVLPLMELLQDEEWYVRGGAAFALGQIQAKEAVLPLIGLLRDEQRYVRENTIFALWKLGAKEALLPLMGLLMHEDGSVRKRAASVLGQVQAKEVFLPLIELLKHQDRDVRRRAASALGLIQAKEAVLPLMALLKDKVAGVRGRAASALGKIRVKEAALPLVGLLKDEVADVRQRATSALGMIQAKEAVLPLLELLKDKESYVRASAASALGRIQAKEAVLPLLELLKDKESYVRRSAASALGQIQAKEAVLPLLELLKDKESYIRGGAASALGQIQTEETVLPLIGLLKDEVADVRRRATSALGMIQAKEAVLPLIELLKDEGVGVRKRAAYALGEIGDKKAVESLKQLLNDRDREVRDSAFSALKEISEKTGIPIYKE
jgi:HEAT repeat protein/GTPase SAR1 family protein